MSALYIQRLRAIRGELDAARQAIAFVSRYWDKYAVYKEVDDVTPADFRRTSDFLFATYLVRLSAEFEGILKLHLTSRYPSVAIPKDAKVDWLISQVTQRDNFKIDKPLRGNLEKVRTYRNDFVHSGTLPDATFTFDAALSWFNTFLAKLPDPGH